MCALVRFVLAVLALPFKSKSRFTGPEISGHTPCLADFITIMSALRFSVGGRARRSVVARIGRGWLGIKLPDGIYVILSFSFMT